MGPIRSTVHRVRVLGAAAVIAVLLVGCGAGGAEPPPNFGPAVVEGERIVLTEPDGSELSFLVGVNLGPTIPGHHPGELAIRREDVRRWLPQIAALGIRVLRVYTVQPPHVYEEIAAYNSAHPDAPLYVVHGVWIPEERFLETHDLFDPDVVAAMETEIADAVDAVHGNLVRDDRPGHASGTYTADVSPWTVAWILGVEWDPVATHASDAKNAGIDPYRGDYFENPRGTEVSPTEVWLARMLDVLAREEAGYGRSVPLAFVNWPTTDPLVHPDEPLPKEDLVGVDANHVLPTDAWPAGTFASYHAYPYYPDFQRYESGIADFELAIGGTVRVDPYAGYLTKLRDHHAGMPVVVSEFGVPSSIGAAHLGPLGRHQGTHSEQEAMAIDADLLRVIEATGMAGGFVFEWTDEWFKFTWNTIDHELPPDRRALWMNPWTNEAHFGLVAVEPGDAPPVIVDGDGAEWDVPGHSPAILESAVGVREVRATHDEGYLYLRLVLDEDELWERRPVLVAFDVVPGGGGPLPGGIGGAEGADVVVRIAGHEAVTMVRASNDPFLLAYGVARTFVPVDPEDVVVGSGVWNPWRLIMNKPLVVPTTGERHDAEVLDVGTMRRGTSDPTDPAFDSRALWAAQGRVVEMRLPWASLGMADPSSRQGLVAHMDGTFSTVDVERVGIVVLADAGLQTTRGYAWEGWQQPSWHERTKAGIGVLAATIAEIAERTHAKRP